MRPVLSLVLLAMLAGCASEVTTPLDVAAEAARNPAGVIVAQVGRRRYTLADILASLARGDSFAQERFHAASAKLSYLQSFVDFQTLVHEGLARALQRRPAVARALKSALAKVLWEKGKLPGLDRARALVEPRLRAFHQAHRDAFREPDRARVAQILIKLPPGRPLQARTALQKTAQKVLAQLGPAPDQNRFGAVARSRSEDERSRARGGDMGWLARGVPEPGVPPEVMEAVFRLRPGETSGLVQSTLGAHILRVEAFKPGKPARFELVRKQVEARLWEKLRREALGRLVQRLRSQVLVSVVAAQASALGQTSRWLQ